MSSILKALKRLEEEKAQREAAAAGLSGRVVKSGFVVDRPSPWRLPLAMVAVAAVAVTVTYGVMGGFGSKPTPGSSPASPAPAAPVQAAASTAPAAATTRLAPQVVTSPMRQPASGTTPTPVPATSAPAGRPAPPGPVTAAAPQGGGGEATVPVAPAAARPEPSPVTTAPSPPTEPARPSLQVSGIAWQKDAASRVAMVNGAAVTKGAVVGKARVEEIFPDRVRFSLDGRSFDIPLGAGSGGSP